jgi:nucleotide-binding universal stress UspA family protein
MYNKMLVPLDGSELSEVVFPYAKELAARMGLEVVLLHVASPALHIFAPMQKAYVERAAALIRRQAKEAQEKSGVPKEGKGLKVKGEVVEGDSADEILRYAAENSADLILMATHGRSEPKRWAMGSIADKVSRTSTIPVWLVRAGLDEEKPFDQWPSRTLIVPLDGSELAEAVLPHVEALVKQQGTEPFDIILLRVSEPPTTPFYYAPELSGVPLNWGEYVDQAVAKDKEMAAEYLAGTEKKLKDAGIKAKSEVLVGKAADEIITYLTNRACSIIVMATHGRSGVKRWVYGSVVQDVLLGVSCPVLLVRPKDKGE